MDVLLRGSADFCPQLPKGRATPESALLKARKVGAPTSLRRNRLSSQLVQRAGHHLYELRIPG